MADTSLFVLDTDTLSLFQRGSRSVFAKLSEHAPGNIAITVITVEEQVSGWFALLRRAKDPTDIAKTYHRLAETVRFCGQIRILHFTEEAIAQYEVLRKLKLNVGSMDLKIAATTIVHEGTLVTRNRVDFQRVPDLKFVDWST